MCGIVGYSGSRTAMELLLGGLRRLEYRGYDSAGVAWFGRNHTIAIQKSEGKLQNVERLIRQGSPEAVADAMGSHCGIGHTRWATHGKPTTQNAHPHQTGHVVLVHNGIIENYQEIRADLMTRGHRPRSETDSELYGFMLLEAMADGRSLKDAVLDTFPRLQGACSVVVMSEREPGTIIGVRNGTPLVAAVDPQGGAILASDAQALIEVSREVLFLENGDVCVATAKGIEVYDLATRKKIERASTTISWSLEQLDKRGFEHFMLKEIFEQPTALVDTLNGLVDRASGRPFELASQPGVTLLDRADRLLLVACGTSWHAALEAKYWFEKYAQIPVEVDLASEVRYRGPVVDSRTLVVAISQSGETADTLAVVRDLRARGVPTLAITNVRGSTLSREAEAALFTSAGPEIGVAATKTFLTQMWTLLTLAGAMGVRRKTLSELDAQKLFDGMIRLPYVLTDLLGDHAEAAWPRAIREIAREFSQSRGYFFFGRGYSYPIALEGALKLKEIAYVHAEGYAAGELKHGPIAMIDPTFTVVALCPMDHWREKTVSNIEEVKARGARIIGIGHASDTALQSRCDRFIAIPADPKLDAVLTPFLMTPALQLLSYSLALLKGTDVDQPRNLAKSVTVE